MKSTTKKLSVMLLSVTMLGGLLAGCGSDNQAANSGKNAGSNAGSNKGANQADTKEATTPITFSFFSSDGNPNWNKMQDDVGKVITEKTGVTLNAEFAVGDPGQKVALIASSGEYPDLISAKGDVSKLVDAGAMIDLTDLIDKYAPNIKKVYGDQMKRLQYSNEDKSIYVIPTYGGVGQTSFNAGGGFELQHAVVKELGYPKIRTVKDFENAIKAYKEKHPTIDGKPTIGLTLNADDWHMYISVTNPGTITTGGQASSGEYYIDPKTYKVTYHYRRPEEKQYFKWLNHMNAIGLLDPESFVQKHDQYNAKIASGRVLGLIDADWDYGDGEKALKAAGKFERTYGHYPVTMSEEYKDSSFQPTGFLAGWGVGITTACKDPIRAIKFLDYLASDEGQVLINWGIEGKQYKVENGKRVIPKEIQDRKTNDANNFAKETGIGFYGLMSAHYGDGVKDPSGNYYTTNFPEQVVASFSDADKETLKAYGATTWKDLFPKEDEFETLPWGAAWNIPIPGDSDVNVLATKMRDITWKRIPEAILAKPEKFDAIWDAYQKELVDAGVEKYEAGFGELVKARVALWNN
jgi:putative aldouronate transport system substrate-binding protein